MPGKILTQNSFLTLLHSGLEPMAQVQLEQIFTLVTMSGFGKPCATLADFKRFMRSPEKSRMAHGCTGPIEILGLNPQTESICIQIQTIDIKNARSCVSKSTGILRDQFSHRTPQIYNCREPEKILLDCGTILNGRPSIGFIASLSPRPLKTGRCFRGGGNLDYNGLGVGARIFLPVFSKRVMIAAGDVHFLQGAGEISGMGIESEAEIGLQAFACEKVRFPIIETASHVVICGSGLNAEKAMRSSVKNALAYLRSQKIFNGMSISKLYQLLGGCGDLQFGNLTGKTPSCFVAIEKSRFYPVLSAPKVIIRKKDRVHKTLLRQAVAGFKNLPKFHKGDSREIRTLPEHPQFLVAKLNPRVYSFRARGTVRAPGSEFERAAMNAHFSEILLKAGIKTSTLATQGEFVLMRKEKAASSLEVIVKRAMTGSPRHEYQGIMATATITGSPIYQGQHHQAYVRFDWRNPSDQDDRVLPEGLAAHYINLRSAKDLALRSFAAIRTELQKHEMDLLDGCFFMNQAGDTIIGEVSADNLASIFYTGNDQYLKTIFSANEKSALRRKWAEINRILLSRTRRVP